MHALFRLCLQLRTHTPFALHFTRLYRTLNVRTNNVLQQLTVRKKRSSHIKLMNTLCERCSPLSLPTLRYRPDNPTLNTQDVTGFYHLQLPFIRRHFCLLLLRIIVQSLVLKTPSAGKACNMYDKSVCVSVSG